MKFIALSLCCFLLCLVISVSSFYYGVKYQEHLDDKALQSCVSTGAVLGLMYADVKFRDKPSHQTGRFLPSTNPQWKSRDDPEVEIFTEQNPDNK